MAAAPVPMTDADVVSTMNRILAHAPDAADAPAPVNIPHRLLRDVRSFSLVYISLSLHHLHFKYCMLK